MRRKRNYEIGDWFAVPLRSGGYASGLIARRSRRGVLLGYFFGPKTNHIPSLQELESLKPQAAVLVELFGDLGLLKGEWPILGRSKGWDLRDWPIPVFVRQDDLSGVSQLVEYSEDGLQELRNTP